MSQSFSFLAQNGPLLLIRDAIDFSLIDGNTIIIFITDAIEDWISHTSVYVFESTQIQGEFLSKYEASFAYLLSANVLKKGKNFSCTNQKYVTRTCIVELQLCRAYKKSLMMIDWIICVYFTICTLTSLPISGFLLDEKSLQNLPYFI